METTKKCSRCEKVYTVDNFIPTKNFLYKDKLLPMCSDCIERLISKYEEWGIIDNLCQYADIPFIPEQWHKIYESNKEKSFPIYNSIFLSEKYSDLNWKMYYDEFKKLEKEESIKKEIPLVNNKLLQDLKTKWGFNYDNEELDYLESLYKGILSTQNINGKLQTDQAQKLCKISLEINKRIENNEDFDKLLSSYDKLVKVSDMTPKNVKNMNDFDSVGEIYAYLEKTGWINRFYDDVKRDIVDESIANIQNFCRRLWVNETGMSEEIERRLQALKSSTDLEKNYGINSEIDNDKYDSEVLEPLEEEEFKLEI